MKLSEQLAGKNFGPRFSQAISAADDQIEYLRTQGLNREADLFARQISEKIQKRDESIANNLSALGQVYSVNLRATKPSGEKGEVEAVPDLPVIADRIQDALRLGEDSNIRVSPVLIQNAFEAEIGGDAAGAFRAAKAIEKEVEDQRKQQVDEERVLQTLADGSQVLIGKKTGTRYSASGIPLSSGPINTSIYNKVAESTGVLLQPSQPTATIQASPQVYEQPVQQAPSRARESIALMQEAQDLYDQGNKKGALAIIQGLRMQSFMGGTANEDDLEAIFGTAEEESSQEPTPTSEGSTKKGTPFKIVK